MGEQLARVPRDEIELSLEINREKVKVRVPRTKRLISILREDLLLTGTKVSCEIGRCGACMVLLDGQPVNSCMTMAYQCEGKAITTIEGLSADGVNPVQQAFLEEGGYQCGYCTPGMVVTVHALLKQCPNPTADDVEEALSGSLCRCTGYGGILRAVRRAVELSGGDEGDGISGKTPSLP